MIAFSSHLLSRTRRHELYREQRIRSGLKALGFVLALSVAAYGGFRSGRMQALEACVKPAAVLIPATERATAELEELLAELGLWVYGTQLVRGE